MDWLYTQLQMSLVVLFVIPVMLCWFAMKNPGSAASLGKALFKFWK